MKKGFGALKVVGIQAGEIHADLLIPTPTVSVKFAFIDNMGNRCGFGNQNVFSEETHIKFMAFVDSVEKDIAERLFDGGSTDSRAAVIETPEGVSSL